MSNHSPLFLDEQKYFILFWVLFKNELKNNYNLCNDFAFWEIKEKQI